MDIITHLGKWLLTTLRGSDSGDDSGNLYILRTDDEGRLEVKPQPTTVTLQGYDYNASTERAVAVDEDGVLQVNTQAPKPLFFPAQVARESGGTYHYNTHGSVNLPAGVATTTAYTLHIPAGYTRVTPVFSAPFAASGDVVLSFYVSYGAVGGSDVFTELDSVVDEVITVTASTVMAGTEIDLSALPADKITTLLSIRNGDDANDTVTTGMNFLGWWLE